MDVILNAQERIYFYEAELVRIVDGDTIDVILDRGFKDYSKKRVRVLGVDTDEIRGRGVTPEGKIRGIAATARVKELLDKSNSLYIRTKLDKNYDSFGRVLGWVYFDKEGTFTNLGELLYEEGFNKLEE